MAATSRFKRKTGCWWNATTLNSVTGGVTQIGWQPWQPNILSRPLLSADGSKVTFLSRGQLGPNPANGPVQLYQRDMGSETTRLLSADTNGLPSTDLSSVVAAVTPDGSWV